MKISKDMLKELIAEELKEVVFASEPFMGRRPKDDADAIDKKMAKAKAEREREEIATADTEVAPAVKRQDKFNSGGLRSMSEEDRQLYFVAQGKGEFAGNPEKMRLAVVRLLRDKYNL
jgi:hypothetical protein